MKKVTFSALLALAMLSGYSQSVDKAKNDQFIEDATKAIAADKNDVKAYYGRGLAYYYKGDDVDAINDFIAVTQLNPKNADAWFHLGRVYLHQAETWGSQKSPDNSDFSKNEAKRCAEAGVKSLTNAVELNPKGRAAYYCRAYCKKIMADYEGAIADFTIAIATEPGNVSFYNDDNIIPKKYHYNEYEIAHSNFYAERGIAAYEAGRYDSAIADFSKSTTLFPNDCESYGLIALCKFELKDEAGAVTALDKEMAINKEHGCDEIEGISYTTSSNKVRNELKKYIKKNCR